jgi:magnesium transporter
MPQTFSISHLRVLLEQQRWPEIRTFLAGWPTPEIAALLLTLETIDRIVLFRVLPRQVASEVFSHLETEQQRTLLQDLSADETREILAHLAPDDRTQLFEELPGRVTQQLLNLLRPEDRREAQLLLGYPEESVGRLMTPDYVAVRPQWTIGQALDHIRRHGRDSETINMIYVTDDTWKLLDALELRRFILADPVGTVAQIMDRAYVWLSVSDDREQAVHMMQRYDLPALPVIDADGVLVGIVTFDDVMDVAEEEATEDFYKTAAVMPLESSYPETGMIRLYRKRIGWLLALAGMNLFSGAAMAAFEDTIANAVVLLFFLPLLIASSGNAGAQAATLMVRALAMGAVPWHA